MNFLSLAGMVKILEKLRNLRRGESPFFQRPLGLQTRITLLFAIVVVSVLVLFSYLEFRLTGHSQREVWRERTIYVTRELDAKVYSIKDLENTAFLEEEIGNWMHARPSIKSIDFFVFQKNSYKVVASSWEGKDLGISYQSLDSLKTRHGPFYPEKQGSSVLLGNPGPSPCGAEGRRRGSHPDLSGGGGNLFSQ